MVTEFYNQEAEYASFLGVGPAFVCNNLGFGREWHKIHRSDCNVLRRAGPAKVGLHTTVRKACSRNLEDLTRWLNERYGVEGQGYTFCRFCLPREALTQPNFNGGLTWDQRPSTTYASGSTVAEEMARRLVQIYQENKIPESIETFGQMGFTRERLRQDESALFQLVILASYDRQPFTRVARGWEAIWGLKGKANSLAGILQQLDLLEPVSVLRLPLEVIDQRLQTVRFFKYRIDTDRVDTTAAGGRTRYARTFRESAEAVLHKGLWRRMTQSETVRDVEAIHRMLDDIHGIGETIASKVVMYTVRELQIGNVAPSHFSQKVSRPLLGEYHNAKLAQELERLFGAGVVEVIFDHLVQLGDTMAIDALYYIDRDAPILRQPLLDGL